MFAVRILLVSVVAWLGVHFLATHSAAEEPNPDACLYERQINRVQSLCIRRVTYHRDLCGVIEHYAGQNALPPEFFARLIWRESLFKANVVSPKGAEGISQFMPSTARMRGLSNTFDVIEALGASAVYLHELKKRFGNLGLAAAAYNAGEAGLQSFLKSGRLPLETRDYVFAITGYPAETWKEKPPEIAAPPLNPEKTFLDGCVDLARTRRIQEPILMGSADWAPWGVQLSAHFNPGLASRFFALAVARLPSPLNAERALIVRQRGGRFGPRPRYAARIGRETRAQAVTLCREIRAAGVSCIILRN